MFAAAPGGGITVHVDAGSKIPGLSHNMGTVALQGGDTIADSNTGKHIDVVYFHLEDASRNPILPVALSTIFPGSPVKFGRSFDDIKNTFFGTADKRAREFAFHYAVFADRNTSLTDNHSGLAELTFRNKHPTNSADLDLDSIPGNDLIVSLQGRTAWRPGLPTGFLQAQTLAHELGHNLGLRHGGVDTDTSSPPSHRRSYKASEYKPAYLSLMNYAYQSGLDDLVLTASPDTLTAQNVPFAGMIGGTAQLGGSSASVAIISGVANGQTRAIAANTSDQLTVLSPWGNVPTLGDGFVVRVRDYSRLGDPVFNDWDNIQLDFSNYADFLGNSFERSRSGVSLEPENPELDLTEIEESIGPLDREVPTVTISAPAPNTSIPLGTPLVVRFVATDDIGIDVNAVGVSFDLDGDGTFDDPGETIPAVQTGPNSFEAVFARVSGPVGTRLVLASVKDLAGRAEGASVAVVVSSGLASNTPPTANAGPDQTVVAGVGCLVTVSLDGRDSSDPDGDALTFTWTGPFGTASGPTPTVSLPLGTHTITLTVDDGKGGTASDQVVVTVQDTTAPVPDLASLPTVTGECSAQITSPPTATDSCAGKITGTTSDPLSYSQQGTFTVTWTFSDGKGNAATQIQIVIVKDVTPPNIQSVTATPNSLWPPNHKMVPVTVAVSTLDNCSGAPVCRISSVSSNEPVNGTGDGDTAPDWEITGNLTVNLRAERSGSGNGRVYTITVACTDASGNSSTKTTTVTVPHDQGKK